MKRKMYRRFLILMLISFGIFTAFECYAYILEKNSWCGFDVVDKDTGQAVPRLQVTAARSGGSDSDCVVEMDDNGIRWVIQFRKAGQYEVYCRAENYSEWSFPVEVSDVEGEGHVYMFQPVVLQRYK